MKRQKKRIIFLFPKSKKMVLYKGRVTRLRLSLLLEVFRLSSLWSVCAHGSEVSERPPANRSVSLLSKVLPLWGLFRPLYPLYSSFRTVWIDFLDRAKGESTCDTFGLCIKFGVKDFFYYLCNITVL